MLMESHINCNPFLLQAITPCSIDNQCSISFRMLEEFFPIIFDNKSTIVGFNTLVQEYSRHDKTLIQNIIFLDYISSGQTD
jgi:hypothetical protein